MRTQKGTPVTEHLSNSRKIFLHLVERYRVLDHKKVATLREERDYEGLELLIIEHLLGV